MLPPKVRSTYAATRNNTVPRLIRKPLVSSRGFDPLCDILSTMEILTVRYLKSRHARSKCQHFRASKVARKRVVNERDSSDVRLRNRKAAIRGGPIESREGDVVAYAAQKRRTANQILLGLSKQPPSE
jgi:hypothetical protein